MTRLPLRAAAVAAAGILTTTAAPSLAAGLSAATAPPPRCASSALALSWAPGGTARPGGVPDEQVTARVAVENVGSHSCTLRGYPGVTLKRSESVVSRERSRTHRQTRTQARTQTETLRDQLSVKPETVVLAPHKSARFTLTFLSSRAHEENVIDPREAVVTLPDTTGSHVLTWRWGPVLRQESATHPGNYVSPVRS
ncbi:hypothetical protein ADL22_19895 [Streptomyces sp. NRRL F-4489]|uniref:DUF4232 domain-containing protein n=1 Tax=Streptomyces sp. NRRL F-4489 TaxID=1609095 RepID=UPI000749EDD8|nr:DUF4232 domain-containing protein [Streptomyces sp. NRRL F-4489]KUL37902.1 hypothetical protein ADL22_19895 [Streptomyces sp. NRRL F-4489]